MFQYGEVLDNTYQIIGQIGEGGTGEVYKAVHIRLQKYVVVKKIKDHFLGVISNVRAEVDILKKLKHTYLPQVYDFVQHGYQVYTVMDYIEGYDLKAYIKAGYRFEEEILLKWFRQLCEVLSYLHGQIPPIIHSDIKPENIMITTEGNVCLIDFNISLDRDDSAQINGITLPYASPEQYTKALLFQNGQEHGHIILDGRTDIYSLGATFYELMAEMPPAKPYDYTTPLANLPLSYSGGLVSVIDKAMVTDLNYRYQSAGEMIKSVNNLYKRTKEYRHYLCGVVVSAVLYVIVMCVGISSIVYGLGLREYEQFEKSSRKMMQLYELGDYEHALDAGYDILNNQGYKGILKKSSVDRIMVFHTMGECFFEYEDYENAAEYYGEAAKNITDMKKYSDYYRDYIIALIRAGWMENALDELKFISDEGISSTDIEFVNAEVLMHEKKYEEAFNKISVLLEKNTDEKTKMHLLLLGSDAAFNLGNRNGQIDYLKQAYDMEQSVGILRKLGSAYMDAVNTQKMAENSKREYYEKARECYLELTERNYASLNDHLNFVICCRALGEYKESLKRLKELEQEYSDYRIFMYMAFVYDKIEDGEQAEKYVKKCLALYENTADSEKESKGSDNIQSLFQLEKKYK